MKWLGVVLLLMSAAFLVAAGAEEAGFLVPGGIFGITGLWCWDRGGRNHTRREIQRADTGVAERLRAIEERLASMQDQVTSHHIELFELRDQRDFFSQLYGSPRSQTHATPS